jgi:hypothetical protein
MASTLIRSSSHYSSTAGATLLKSCALACLFLIAPLLARAQSYDWELYGGYQATRGDIGRVQALADQLIGATVPSSQHIWMNGGSLSIAEYKTPWFAGIIDLTAAKGVKTLHYRPPPASSFALQPDSADPALYTLTAGPQFRIPYRGRVQPVGRVLFGAARVNLSLDPQLEAALKRSYPPTRSTQTSFAVQTGGGLDYELTPHFGLRSTADYLGTWFFHDLQANLLISGGAIFRW